MGMTMTQKILAKHAGLDSVKAGDLIYCSLDLVMANDITAPPSIAAFKKVGRPVFDREKIVLVPDHFQPAKDIKSAGLPRLSGILPGRTGLSIILNRAGWALNMPSFRKKDW